MYSTPLSGAFLLFWPNMVIYIYICHFTAYLHYYSVYWEPLDTSNQLLTLSWGTACVWKARSQHIVQQSSAISNFHIGKAHQKRIKLDNRCQIWTLTSQPKHCILPNFHPIENLKLLVIYFWFIGINGILWRFFYDYIIHPYPTLVLALSPTVSKHSGHCLVRCLHVFITNDHHCHHLHNLE